MQKEFKGVFIFNDEKKHRKPKRKKCKITRKKETNPHLKLSAAICEEK